MEESDNMLITTLKEHIDVPNHINTLSDIRAEEMLSISIKILEYLKADTTQIKSLSAKQQKFRSMAKLNQCLQGTLQSNFELNQLMNPSVPFLRKFMLVVVNKLGYGDNADKSKAFSIQSRTTYNATKQKTKLKQWLNSEWIHPSLSNKKPKYKGYILPLTINKNMLKNNVNITQQLNNHLLQGNGQSTLNMTSAKLNQMVKQFQANEGISRKEYEQAQIRIQNIIKNNKDDWFINYNKLNKIKKKIIEEKEQPSSEIQIPLVTSVFKQQLQQAQLEAESKKQLQEIKPKQKSEVDTLGQEINLNPLQLLRKQAENKKNQYEQEIRQIVNELQSRKDVIESWQKEKEQIHEKMYADEQKMTKLKQQTAELKKHVQKRQNILATLEGEKNIEEEVSKLEEEIKMIEAQAKQEVDSIQLEIKQMQVQSKQKMEALNDLKTKLNKIQTDYSKICEEISEKEEIKGKVKIMKSSISRLYYHKKISDMESRWREQQKEIKKLKTNLVELRQKTRISSTLSQRVETEIENIINNEKAKKEEETKPLRQLINKCKEYFHATLKTLQEVNEVKLQTQDYEVKVHALSGKNFKQNIQKINMAMQDLKQEMAELNKSKLK